MAVKRVIMQHFSMKSDYMNRERSNFNRPSRSGTISFDSLSDSYTENAYDYSSADLKQCESLSNGDDYGDNDADDENDMFGNAEKCFDGSDTVNQSYVMDADVIGEPIEPKLPSSLMKQMNSISEQLQIASRTLHDRQIHNTGNVHGSGCRIHRKLASSYGLGSIIELREKLPLDDSDTSATPDTSPFKILCAIDSGIDTTTKKATLRSMKARQVSGGQVLSATATYDADASLREKPIIVNTRANIRPEENWRSRSNNTNSIEFHKPFGSKQHRQFMPNVLNPLPPLHLTNKETLIRNTLLNHDYGCPIFSSNDSTNNKIINNNNNSSSNIKNSNNGYRKPIARNDIDHPFNANGKFKGVNNLNGQSHGIDLRNWRNECTLIRNCGLRDRNETGNRRANFDCDDTDLNIGLSPPSESLLLQRRMMRRSDIDIRNPPPQTASG